jgi:2-polyprenyl-6-methoxyphenol hydroxylase-like FAD-dependent oxidoreductase
MTATSELPVLIVGGGAVGCVLSMELARRGVEHRCIDRMSAPGREPSASRPCSSRALRRRL